MAFLIFHLSTVTKRLSFMPPLATENLTNPQRLKRTSNRPQAINALGPFGMQK